MKIVKRIMSALVAVVMIFCCSISVFAISPKSNGEVQIVSSEDQLFFTTKELEEQAAKGGAGLGRLVPRLDRVGSTTTVRLYLYWIATCNTTQVKYSSMKVISASSVSPKTYKSFAGTTKTLAAEKIQHVYIGQMTIPKNVSAVRVIFKNVSVYFLPDGTAFWSVPKSDNVPVVIGKER